MMMRKKEKSKEVIKKGKKRRKHHREVDLHWKTKMMSSKKLQRYFEASTGHQDSKTLSKVSTWPGKHCLARPLSARC